MNQKGQLTLEFMLGIILVITVSALLGVLTFALSLTEALQYVTFSAARSYIAGDSIKDNQEAAGNRKAQSLLKTLPFLNSAQANGWIKVKSQLGANDYAAYRDQIGAGTNDRSQFQGYQVQFTVPMLNISLPFLKQAIAPPNGNQDFAATLSSFLMREPTFEECHGYLQAAAEKLLGNLRTFYVIVDNGC